MSEWDVTDDDWEAEDGPRILVVDDDPAIRKLLSFIFEDEGYNVTAANDGSEALVVLEARPPDAMVLDLMMPNVDGHEVLRQRGDRDLAPDTRVLVLTAKSDPRDQVWCWELGADQFMNKPVEPERCVREVEILLRSTADEVRERRERGLAEAKRLDAMEAAFDGRRKRR